MTNLTTIEEGLTQELLAHGVDDLIEDFMGTAEGYKLPTSEIEATKLLILVAERKLEILNKIDRINLDQEMPF